MGVDDLPVVAPVDMPAPGGSRTVGFGPEADCRLLLGNKHVRLGRLQEVRSAMVNSQPPCANFIAAEQDVCVRVINLIAKHRSLDPATCFDAVGTSFSEFYVDSIRYDCP